MLTHILQGALFLASVLATVHCASAAPDEFAGKTITIIVGAPPGGVLDLFARPVAEFLPAHVPGHPKVVLSYMPGAASKVAARHLYAAAPRDGTWLAAVFPSVMLDALFEPESARGYDPAQFAFIGSAQSEVNVCILRKDAEVRSLEDLASKELPIAVTAPGSTNFDFPQLTNGLDLTHFKLVKGYSGGQALRLAMERDEAKGTCGSWSAFKSYYPDILSRNTAFFVAARGDPGNNAELNRAHVPQIGDLLTNDLDRRALELYLLQNKFASPFILPPAVAPARVAVLRSAFIETLRDQSLLEQLARVGTTVAPVDGAEVQSSVAAMLAADSGTVDRLRRALGREPK